MPFSNIDCSHEAQQEWDKLRNKCKTRLERVFKFCEALYDLGEISDKPELDKDVGCVWIGSQRVTQCDGVKLVFMF